MNEEEMEDITLYDEREWHWRVMEETKGLGQKNRKDATKDCFLFDSSFASKMSSEAVIVFGTFVIGTVKINKKI